MKRPDPSLKSIIPYLASKFEMNPFALYERQRALVRAGLIHAVPGRGAGSGVRATPHSLAMLLISLVATQSLVEVAKETKIVANLKSDKGTCPITGKKTFGAALTAIVASGGVRYVQVRRSGMRHHAVFVQIKAPRELVDSEFGDEDPMGILTTTIRLFLPRDGFFFEKDKK